MPIAKVNGIDLYYEATGAGAPLVFIPGLSGTTDLWAYQLRYFRDHYRTISLDNRGAGRSDKPQGTYSMETFARDLNDLLDFLEISEPVYLVGASMGGIIAQAFIHDYPQRVNKLVLACSGVSGGDPHITPCSRQVLDKLANPGVTIEEKVDTFLEIFFHPEYVASHPEIRTIFLKYKSGLQPTHAYKAQFDACADPRPYYEWLAAIKAPVLVIHGDEDVVWPLQNARTLIEGLRGNGKLYVMEKAAHVLMQERPEEFNRILHEFFGR